ncbi:hypothetical protein QQG55_41785 [Brugia pahangi]
MEFSVLWKKGSSQTAPVVLMFGSISIIFTELYHKVRGVSGNERYRYLVLCPVDASQLGKAMIGEIMVYVVSSLSVHVFTEMKK